MRSRKSQDGEEAVSFEKMNLATTCFIRLNMTFMYLVTTSKNSYDALEIGRVFDHCKNTNLGLKLA